jgi:hypothetical protein
MGVPETLRERAKSAVIDKALNLAWDQLDAELERNGVKLPEDRKYLIEFLKSKLNEKH